MCLQDWRLGRLITATPFSYVGVVAGTVVAKPNQSRVGLTISCTNEPPSNFDFVSFTIGGISAIGFGVNGQPLHITFANHGSLPTKGFIVDTTGVALNLGVIEYTMPEEYLLEALESFKREYHQWHK